LMSLSASEFCARSGVEAIKARRRAHKPVRVMSASAVKILDEKFYTIRRVYFTSVTRRSPCL
jgi:hypothetical protein